MTIRDWSDEKKANVRKLYAEGMPLKKLATALKCGKSELAKLLADIPKPMDYRTFNKGYATGYATKKRNV